jgi:hypothetical protein
MTTPKLPVVLCEPAGDITWRFWCPFCRRHHVHGGSGAAGLGAPRPPLPRADVAVLEDRLHPQSRSRNRCARRRHTARKAEVARPEPALTRARPIGSSPGKNRTPKTCSVAFEIDAGGHFGQKSVTPPEKCPKNKDETNGQCHVSGATDNGHFGH